jgi:hypothetical protein
MSKVEQLEVLEISKSPDTQQAAALAKVKLLEAGSLDLFVIPAPGWIEPQPARDNSGRF